MFIFVPAPIGGKSNQKVTAPSNACMQLYFPFSSIFYFHSISWMPMDFKGVYFFFLLLNSSHAFNGTYHIWILKTANSSSNDHVWLCKFNSRIYDFFYYTTRARCTITHNPIEVATLMVKMKANVIGSSSIKSQVWVSFLLIAIICLVDWKVTTLMKAIFTAKK